jgi:His-Xaa-Ser system protein HxsD
MNRNTQKVSVDFDVAIYSMDAVKNASYDFTDKANIFIEMVSGNRLRVTLEPKKDMNSSERDSMSEDFIRLALDHQVRIDVAKEYKLIREMIVAQAFEPVDNLEQVMKAFKP